MLYRCCCGMWKLSAASSATGIVGPAIATCLAFHSPAVSGHSPPPRSSTKPPLSSVPTRGNGVPGDACVDAAGGARHGGEAGILAKKTRPSLTTVVSDTDRSVDATDCGEDRPPPPGALDADGGHAPPHQKYHQARDAWL